MILHVSDDAAALGRERYLCECRGVKGPDDPLIEVVPETGDVYAAWMNDFNVYFCAREARRTWSEPSTSHTDVRWGDKPILATSADAPMCTSRSTARPAATATSPHRMTRARVDDGPHDDGRSHYFAYGGHVAQDGTVVFSEVTFSYTGPDDEAEGPIFVHVLVSADGGATWTDTVVRHARARSPARPGAAMRTTTTAARRSPRTPTTTS